MPDKKFVRPTLAGVRQIVAQETGMSPVDVTFETDVRWRAREIRTACKLRFDVRLRRILKVGDVCRQLGIDS